MPLRQVLQKLSRPYAACSRRSTQYVHDATPNPQVSTPFRKLQGIEPLTSALFQSEMPNTSSLMYCNCGRSFKDSQALMQHTRDSRRHSATPVTPNPHEILPLPGEETAASTGQGTGCRAGGKESKKSDKTRHSKNHRVLWSSPGDFECYYYWPPRSDYCDYSICDKDCGWCGHCMDHVDIIDDSDIDI
jgi:hypothetical protein